MKPPILMVAAFLLIASSSAHADRMTAASGWNAHPTALKPGAVRSVLPVVGREMQETVVGDRLPHIELQPRERSIITLAALIAQNDSAWLQCHLGSAFENGVEPSEVSEMITHLAFYVGCACSSLISPSASVTSFTPAKDSRL